MNYMEMMRQRNPEKIAIIEDGIPYTYGQLVDMAEKLGSDEAIFGSNREEKKRIHMIRRNRILEQLVEFFASSEAGMIPMLVPFDAKVLPEETEAPENVCMAVTTSGTTGIPKILYRTYESWADFFPVQNNIFGIHGDSRLFAQGSLAFTGNLNLYMAQFFAGATVIAENTFQPKKWKQVIAKEKVNAIYLIPSKLMCLPQIMKEQNFLVQTVISGSQSLGREEAKQLKNCFPETEIILYYGASELNYITYVTDKHMTGEKNLIGKPFPGVKVSVHDGEIYVDTPYHVEGIQCPYTLSDKGYLDEEGDLYFAGRSDDIVGIRGRKVSTWRIEDVLMGLPEIEEAAVLLLQEKGHPFLTAFVRRKDNGRVALKEASRQARFLGEVKEERIFIELRNHLAHFEMPCRIIVVEEMPKTESGKINKRKLETEWKERSLKWNLKP